MNKYIEASEESKQDLKEAMLEQWFNNVLELGDTDKLEEVIENNSDLIADYFLTYVKKKRCLSRFAANSGINKDLGEKIQDMIYRKLEDMASEDVEEAMR